MYNVSLWISSSSKTFTGAVANGRAKFEATPKGPEKPSRFFGSRSRTNSPMLPVKTPKVPTAAFKDSKGGSDKGGNSETKKDDSNGGTEVDKKDKLTSKAPWRIRNSRERRYRADSGESSN